MCLTGIVGCVDNCYIINTVINMVLHIVINRKDGPLRLPQGGVNG